MRRYGIYDGTRGLTTAVAAGTAGLLLWCATLVGVQTVTRFWESMGIVAGAGLVLALSQVVAGWTKGGRARVSPSTFALAFLPVLVCVGWILLATQPGNGWEEGRIVSWSHSIGIFGLVHSLGLWHGALALGFGLVFGLTLDTVPVPEVVEEPVRDTARNDTPVGEHRGPRRRRRPTVVDAADEPLTAERDAAATAEPHTVTVGPAQSRTDTQE